MTTNTRPPLGSPALALAAGFHLSRFILAAGLATLALVPTTRAATFIRELFDGSSNNVSVAGQGANLVSGIGFAPGSAWAVNTGGTIFTASNFDVVNGSPDTLPGLSPRLSTLGGLWKGGGNDWGTTIWATRQLDGAAQVNFAQDRVVFFSFRFNNSGDSAMGLGFASGSANTSAFLGVGAHWNGHTALDAVSDPNSIYITDGVLNQSYANNNVGPYASRAHTVAGTVNGNGLVVGRLTLRSSGAETLEVKLYLPGTAIDSDLTAISWNLTYSVTNTAVTNMVATHLLCWLNGSGTGQLDAFRVGSEWLDVTGVLANSPVITQQPQSLTVPCQSNALFTATVTGPQPLSYQWYKNGAPIPGAVANSLAFTQVNGAHSGNYLLVVTNAYGSSTSLVATLTVADTTPPVIYLPTDLSVTTTATAGTNVSYTAFAIDNCDAAASFQCSPASGSFFPIGQTVVNCTAADSVGNRVFSSFVVTVQSATVPPRPAIGFSFVGGGGVLAGPEVAGAPGYAQSNWNNLAGANAAAAGAFPAVIKDSFGGVVSLPALTYAGGPAGGVPVWFEADNTWNNAATTALPDGKLMRGYLDSNSNNTNHPFAAVQGIPYANYAVVVYFDGDDNSRLATGPYWLETFSTATNDLTPRVYGRDTSDFTGAYVQAPLSSTDPNNAAPGNYIVFTNLTSPEFRLRGSQLTNPPTRAILNAFQIVNTEPVPPAAAPAILAQPLSRTAVLGGVGSYYVLATGSAPLSYQWLKDGVPIAAATGSTLTLSGVTSNDIAGYTVVVTNYYGAVTSAPAATLTVLPPRAPAATNVILSEFMASNTRTLADEDGDYSDWIEVYNAGTNLVNLLNWSLTDNAGNRTKWRFPATNLAPGQVLVVFASNKNRRVAGAPLHTNFKLDANPPEYLALVRPDGSIATEFRPAFPTQVPDVSFGFGTEVAETVVLASNATVRYYIPSNSTFDATWMQPAFDDAAWVTGAQGLGFNRGTPQLVGLTSLVAQLKFDAPPASPVVYDSSTNSHAGAGNSVTWKASVAGRAGVMDFNATAPSQITVPPHSDFNSPTGAITFWIRTAGNTGPGSEGAIIFDRRSGSGDVIVVYDNGKIFVQPTGGGSFQTTNTVTDGLWHHVAYVYNQAAGGYIRVYIDGVLSGSSAPSAWAWNISQRLEIGQSHDAYWKRLNGQLDEFCVYNRALSAAEVATLAANTPILDGSLKLRYAFDVVQGGALLADSSPAQHPGFNNGAFFLTSAAGRTGVMQFVNLTPGQVTIPPSPDFNATRGTIGFWMKSAGAIGSGNDGSILFDRRNAGGDVIVLYGDGTLFCQAQGSSGNVNIFHSVSRVDDGAWHHIGYVYDQNAGGGIALYIDGLLNATNANTAPWFWNPNQRIELGQSHDPWWRKYDGYLDDFRIWNRQLSADEIHMVALGEAASTPYPIATDVGSIMLSNSPSAYLRLPFVVKDPQAVSRLRLRIHYDDGFIAYLNGNVVAARNAPDLPAWNATASGRRSEVLATLVEEINLPLLYLAAGTNVVALAGFNRAADDGTFLLQADLTTSEVLQVGVEPRYFAQPTPGQPNNAGTVDLGPILTAVAHAPNVPVVTEDLIVTAKVAPAFNPIRSVLLHYRVNFGPLTAVPMFDDGAHGDGAPGDGLYGALLPASLSVPNDMLRYYVTAEDALGHSSRWPLFGNPTDSAEYLGTVVADPALTSSLPIFHLFVSPDNLANVDTENAGRASFFYDGEFYDNIEVSQRGGTTAVYPKKSHHLQFNHEHQFRHPAQTARIRDTSITSEFVDPSYLRQHLSFWLQTGSGGPAPFHYPVRLQRNGVFYQLGWHTDPLGNDMLSRLGLDPNGALYKGVGQVLPGSPEKKTRKWEGNADYNTMAGALRETNSLATRQTNFFELMDVPEVINYLAGARVTSENDDVWANMSLYRDSDGDGLWRILPFDMNLSWGQLYYADNSALNGVLQAANDANKSHPLYGGATVFPQASWNNLWNRVYDVVVQSPVLREMLLRRQRSIMDRFLQPPDAAPASLVIENFLGTMTNLIWNEAFLDRQVWGWPAQGGPYGLGPNLWLTNGVADLINQFVVPRRTHLYVTHSITNGATPVGIYYTNNAGIPLGQPAEAAVFVADLDVNPASANQAQEYVCLTNPNPYAVDLTGWRLDSAVNFTFPAGTVMPSNSLLYVVKDKLQFRTRSAGPRGGQGLFVVGNYSGQLSARAETIIVKNELGQPVSAYAYAGAPSPAQQFLRVTELMYNPPAGGAYASDEYEYIELKNISGTTTLDLNGVKFTNGISFTFTGSTLLGPGQRLLLVKNQAAFLSRYGAGLPIGGVYLGALDNAGERLVLLDASNEEVLDFAYNNAWYPITDGLGFSLVAVDENAQPDAWGNKSQWRPSGVLNGSPGAADDARAFPAIRVNEVLSASAGTNLDAIELYNPTPSDVDLGGWFLTDNSTLPKKFRIPAGTVINAGGYRVFTEQDFNPGGAGFAFNATGEEAYLFSGDVAGNLTGYRQGFSFGAADTNVTFGRYLTSLGQEHFVAQSSNTLGAANAYPKVGPVVITEIMYRPPDLGTNDNQALEFIELHNISGAPVTLFDPDQATNTWRLRGGVDYEFPTNLTLDASGTLLVVSFDPAADTTAAAAFRAQYGLAADMPLFGPYRGKLNNNGDTIRLQKPTALASNSGPFVLVEEVDYLSAAPWPAAADGTGLSLRRLHYLEYANDPINWAAEAPTPGQVGPSNRPPTARNYFAQTRQNQVLLLPAGRLLLCATDPDGDPLTATLLATTTSNGGTVVFTNHVLAYTPATGYVGADRFSYQLDDARGGAVSVEVTVTVLNPNAASLNIVVPPHVVGTNFHVKFAGIPGRAYRIASAPTVTGPWTPLITLTAGPNGLFELLDPIGDPPPPARFYRAQAP